ncbi:MAG: HNH endonuclease [Fuerstiella sp.]|nr:HNH endonuclease [Fuerstiella sp.]MCP4853911.1 HNH endonuclease [Fuerstiella sp.]
MTPSQARNAIKRCLKSILDPKLQAAEIDTLWAYFNGCCAYCGGQMDRPSRQAYKDHLVPEAEGGTNRLSNIVLSCGACNADEKRESNWEQFLTTKCPNDPATAEQRLSKIRNWVQMNGGPVSLTTEQQEGVDSAFDRINAVLGECVDELRQLAKDDKT